MKGEFNKASQKLLSKIQKYIEMFVCRAFSQTWGNSTLCNFIANKLKIIFFLNIYTTPKCPKQKLQPQFSDNNAIKLEIKDKMKP